MSSLCIKTNNDEILKYLQNEFKDFNMLNVSFSSNEFKNYRNVIIHYKGTDFADCCGNMGSILHRVLSSDSTGNWNGWSSWVWQDRFC